MRIQRKVILLVDDEAVILSVLSVHVKSFLPTGLELLTASNGEDALMIARSLKESQDELICVICDYMMYPMNGSILLGHLEDISPESKKIMLTGQADLAAVTDVLSRARLFRYIEKPWEPKDLELTVLEAINMYNSEVELRKTTQELAMLNKELERKVEDRTAELNQKNEELRQGLQYARFVQECFLPNHRILSKHMNDLCVFSTSSEAVSGDFYWHKEKSDCNYIALGDCTGHGLAGALLTVLVSDLLDDKIGDPNLNLQEAVGEVVQDLKRRLNTSVRYSEMAAGFDLAILKIDKNSKQVDWASLNGNILLIDAENKVESIAKSKGFLHLPGDTLIVASGSFNGNEKRIAMFSDGLYDQIGEETNKRLRLSGLIQWIEEGHVFRPGSSCEIESLFNSWKGNQVHTDDASWLSFTL
ncbi:MAG: response regulator [Bacteroidetes bacterium]|nr:response regulator [Bacteroidota bacterium]